MTTYLNGSHGITFSICQDRGSIQHVQKGSMVICKNKKDISGSGPMPPRINSFLAFVRWVTGLRTFKFAGSNA